MSADRPFVLVVNPRAAAGRAKALVPDLEATFRASGASFETRFTEGPRDATRIVREAIADDASGIAVVGGDGTFSEAACGFFDADGTPAETDAWFAPLPCGTGGDFSRTLGIHGDPIGAAKHALEVEPRPIDCGWIDYVTHDSEREGRAFLNIASFGISGLVDLLVNDSPKWIGGKPAFLLATARASIGYRPGRVRLTVDDGEPEEHVITNLAVANGRFFGAGMEVAPAALIDDGLLDVVTIEAMPVLKLARSMRRMYDGSVLTAAGVHHTRGTRVHAENVGDTGPSLLDVDGEAPGHLPATFVIYPGALNLRA